MPARRILKAMFVEAAARDADELPPELEARAVDRLAWILLFVGLFFAFSIPLRWASSWADGHPSLSPFSTVVSAIFAVVSLATLIVLRAAPLRRATILKAGLVYEVLLCWALALVEQVLVGFAPMPLRLSMVSLVLFTFTLAVPSPPRPRLLATAAGAAALPLALAWISVLLDGALSPQAILLASLPTLLAAVLAGWLSQVVHRLRLDVGREPSYGNYELVEKLGEGGMGEVWRARHDKLVRPAAIKLIRAETARIYGSSIRKRFVREARATGALESPHTVRLYDFGRSEDGTLYYAMELLEGIDCESLVARFGPMPSERVLCILVQTARSLAEAHELGLVHRDIKPANIFLCRAGTEVDFVKVLDFGLVKPRYLAENAVVSVAGAVSGTPGYVAPEQLSGHEIDGRADVYALGCVAYFLLTAKRVFEASSQVELMSAHLTQEPIPPSARCPQLSISREVEALVMAMLRRAPEQRIQNAQELLRQAVAARASLSPWTDERATAWWRAHLPERMKARAPLVL